MYVDKPFTKDNLDRYLKELAKEFRRRNGNKVSAEIILVGGASVLINYGFREMTYDVDAVVRSSGSMKEAINIVGDRFGLPVGWFNTDFTHTNSYVKDLYGSYDSLPEDSRIFIESVFGKENLKAFYRQCRELEQENKEVLLDFRDNYPGVLNKNNLAEILKAAKAKR